jgi:hypothetical protein
MTGDDRPSEARRVMIAAVDKVTKITDVKITDDSDDR